jgi:hypothetical protein
MQKMIECKIEPVGNSGKYVSVSIKIDNTAVSLGGWARKDLHKIISELEKVSEQLENEMEDQSEIELCDDCHTYPKDHPSNLCVGCNEYNQNHF